MNRQNRRAMTGPVRWQGRYYMSMGYSVQVLKMQGTKLVGIVPPQTFLASVPRAVRVAVHEMIPSPSDFDLINAGRESVAHWGTHPYGDDAGVDACRNRWCNLPE